MKDTLQDMQNGSMNRWNTETIVQNGHRREQDEDEDSDEHTELIDVEKACKKLQKQRSVSAQIATANLQISNLPRSIHADWIRKRKLVIHLDIRNTILVADSVTNVFVEEALNSFLTSVVWGKEKNGKWTWYSNIPSLKAPAPGLCTYYKYLERRLVKNTADRAKLRLQTGDFAHTPLGKCFQNHFNVHLARLAWQFHPETSKHKVLTMNGRDGKPYHYILPSVYKLLHELTKKGRDFAVVIRTYGRDADNVLSSLDFGLRGHHPAFRDSSKLKVNKTPGKIERTENTFDFKTFKPRSSTEIDTKLKQERDIYRYLCESKGITGYVDDFFYWQERNYDHAAGKPLWIDPKDERHHHIFFDDNFRAHDEDSIIDLRMFSKENPAAVESIGHSELARLENVFLVQADLLESIADEDYFIRMVNTCEENYAHMLRSGEL